MCSVLADDTITQNRSLHSLCCHMILEGILDLLPQKYDLCSEAKRSDVPCVQALFTLQTSGALSYHHTSLEGIVSTVRETLLSVSEDGLYSKLSSVLEFCMIIAL